MTTNLGGASAPPLFPVTIVNKFNPTQVDDCLENIRINVHRGFPQWHTEDPKKGKFAIVGGGPSLDGTLEDLKRLDVPGNRIVCLNDTLGHLLKNGITPWGMVFNEVDKWHPDAVLSPVKGVRYLVASMAHPSTYDMLEGFDVIQWHAYHGIGEGPIIGAVYPDAQLVGGGHNAALRSINLGIGMGYSDFHLVGMDSSFEGRTHAFTDRPEPECEIVCNGRTFKSQPRLVKQVMDFQTIARTVGHLYSFRTYGDGLFQHAHRTEFPGMYDG